MTKSFTRRRRRFLIALILPMLVMRAFMPAGYMPGEHVGVGFALKFCGSPIPAAGGGPGNDDSHAAQPCAFALGAVAGPLPDVVQVGSLILVPADDVAPVSSEAAAAIVCPRAQSPRGPPALV